MAENEKTSAEIASYASEILKMSKPLLLDQVLWNKIQSIAGSVLTQAPDKKFQLPTGRRLSDGYFKKQEKIDIDPIQFKKMMDLKKK